MPAAPHQLDYRGRAAAPESGRYEWALENERARMLRRRTLWFCGTLIVLSALTLPFAAWGAYAHEGRQRAADAFNLGVSLLHLAALAGAFVYVRRQRRAERRLYALAFWLVVGLGLFNLASARVVQELTFDASFRAGLQEGYEAGRRGGAAQEAAVAGTPGLASEFPPEPPDVVIGEGPAVQVNAGPNPPAPVVRAVTQGISLGIIWWSVFANHLLACLFLPWSVREAARPAVWLLGGAALLVLLDLALGRGSWWYVLGAVIFLPMTPLPGLGWCWWRHSAFREKYRFRFESDQFRKLHRELDGARRLHEANLPPPSLAGPLRMSYAYEPMQQIGGDLIFVHPRPGDVDPDAPPPARHTIILLDVTGHGIAAAMTVARLVGELERLFAERPDLGPAGVMRALNRYAYLTLANHSVFVTGVAASVECDPESPDVWCEPHRLRFTSAGHPTAFVRRRGGAIEPLESDTTMLGVLPPEAFDAAEKTLELGPGDALVAYTDGAAEAADEEGRMLGIAGVRRLVEEAADEESAEDDAPSRWPDRLIRRVAAHRNAPPDDDTLIATIYRPASAPATTEPELARVA